MRPFRALVPALLALIIVAAPSAQASTTSRQDWVRAKSCAEPKLVQSLRAKAYKTETTTREVNGQPRKVVRFYLQSAQEVTTLGIAYAMSPHHQEGGFRWYYDAQTWVDWLPSSPCTLPDGFAFEFVSRGWRTTSPTGVPRTPVASNFDLYAALEYDHSVHDFDPVWGVKHYNPQNTPQCGDGGGFHFFDDSATGELRTWVRVKVRFLSIDYLTQARKTTSEHIELTPAAPLTHGGQGVNEFLDSPTPPSGNVIEVPRPGC